MMRRHLVPNRKVPGMSPRTLNSNHPPYFNLDHSLCASLPHTLSFLSLCQLIDPFDRLDFLFTPESIFGLALLKDIDE